MHCGEVEVNKTDWRSELVNARIYGVGGYAGGLRDQITRPRM